MRLKSVIVGTAGHVDHGKTTLIKALTGIDTDRLKEEKERGITIDIGFAYLELPSGILAGIVDVPGHERFIRNMVVGAGGIDLVMLVVAADEGVMPQTVEHLEICELLGIKNGMVVITKTDLMDPELLELVSEEVKELLKGTFLEGAPIIHFSAVTLEGKERLILELDRLAQMVEKKPIDKPFRLPVDGVFTVKGYGVVVRGTAISGKISVNQEVVIYPRGIRTKVRNIQVHGKKVDTSYAGMRTALNLHGLAKNDVKRGDVVSWPSVLRPTQWLDAELKTVKRLSKPLRNFENLLFYIGTAENMAKLILMVKDELKAGETWFGQLFLKEPVVCWRGDRFILRRPGTNETVAGGRVLNILTQRRKRTKARELTELETLAKAKEAELALAFIKKRGTRGISLQDVSHYLSVFNAKLEALLDGLNPNLVILQEGDRRFLFAKDSLEELKEELFEKLSKYHQANPLSPGLNKEQLKTRLASEPNPLLLDRALEELLTEGKLIKDRELYSSCEHKKLLSTDLESIKEELEKIFLKEGLTPRDVEEILSEFKDRYPLAKELLNLLLREKVLVSLTDKSVYHQKVLEGVKQRVLEYFKTNKELTISDFRELFGGNLSRKYLIPLLEYLDKEKITLRMSDKRVLRRSLG